MFFPSNHIFSSFHFAISVFICTLLNHFDNALLQWQETACGNREGDSCLDCGGTLRFTMHAFGTIAQHAASLWSGNIINSTLYAAGGSIRARNWKCYSYENIVFLVIEKLCLSDKKKGPQIHNLQKSGFIAFLRFGFIKKKIIDKLLSMKITLKKLLTYMYT